MTVWIKARFQLQKEGQYAEAYLDFGLSDWAESAHSFAAFALGYFAATGLRCSLCLLTTERAKDAPGTNYYVPSQARDLYLYLERLKNL